MSHTTVWHSTAHLLTRNLPSHSSASLANHNFPIRRLRPDFIHNTTRPTNSYPVNPSCGPQTKERPRITRALKASARPHFGIPSRSLNHYFDLRAKTIAIRLAAHGLDPQPMSSRRR